MLPEPRESAVKDAPSLTRIVPLFVIVLLVMAAATCKVAPLPTEAVVAEPRAKPLEATKVPPETVVTPE